MIASKIAEIRLIGPEGENVGVVTPARGMELARDAGLDLVEISPNAVPPVCKIMDLGKFKYEQQKREAEARKKQKIIEIKEIKFRPGTDTHDYEVKMRSVMKFLAEGDKVKITLRFRGREMAHQQLGVELLNRVAAEVGEAGKVEIDAQAGRAPDGHDDLAEIRGFGDGGRGDDSGSARTGRRPGAAPARIPDRGLGRRRPTRRSGRG
nr:translation initiation factor IF-3 [Paracoccus sp. (in: a-proteobacteria)]